MSDDWSLKEKHRLNYVSECYGYSEDDVELLREKLIERFDSWCNENLEYIDDKLYKGRKYRFIATDEVSIDEFKNDIKKLFGVGVSTNEKSNNKKVLPSG